MILDIRIKEKYQCGDKRWPLTIEEAYLQASQFTTHSKQTNSRRGIFVAKANNINRYKSCGICGAVCRNVLSGGCGKDGQGRGRGKGQNSDKQSRRTRPKTLKLHNVELRLL